MKRMNSYFFPVIRRRLVALAFFSCVLISSQARATDPGYDDYLKEQSAKCDQLLEEWKKPGGAQNKELENDLITAAVNAERDDVVALVAIGGDPAPLEIKIPGEIQEVKMEVIRDFGKLAPIPYGNRMDVVFRRMTKDRFEAWTPTRGWLFDGKGELVNEAHPPRRDGIGREWHGAFLPNGRWITTDLWEYDRTLTFFSKSGKWLKEIPSQELAPPKDGEGDGHDLIGWARCDREGKGWVVSVGSEGGRAEVFVKPTGPAKILEGDNDPWKLCYPRDLEPKGMYTSLTLPSDDFADQIDRGEPGHGSWVGYPTFTWGKTSKVMADGNYDFGFLPGSHEVFIGTGGGYDDESDEKSPAWETWFFDSDGKCLGWVAAKYLADGPDGKQFWLLDARKNVVTMNAKLKPQTCMQFLVKGRKATPLRLYTDLKVGFFSFDGRLVLARW